MVGRHLGSTLVALLHSMREFRSTPGSNVDDLLKYMRQAQYLDMVGAPTHATAALYVAETFQLGNLYKRAFAHCVGMHDRLFYNSEYQVRNDTPSGLGINPCLLFSLSCFFFTDESLKAQHMLIFVPWNSSPVRYRDRLSAEHV